MNHLFADAVFVAKTCECQHQILCCNSPLQRESNTEDIGHLQSFARQLFRDAADEMSAKLPLWRDAPLRVTMTVYSSEELLFSQLAAQLGLVLKPARNEKTSTKADNAEKEEKSVYKIMRS